MPLSKKRDRARKQVERAKIRLDRQLSQPQLTMRLRDRRVKPVRECEVCGYSDTVDTHHEGADRVEHTLCPTHHALITRGIKTLGQLSPPAGANPVQPKTLDAASPVWLDADGNPVYAD